MKKIKKLLLVPLMLAAMAVPCTLSAGAESAADYEYEEIYEDPIIIPDDGYEDYESDEYSDFYYEQLSDGTIQINGYYGEDTQLTVPSEINGKTVTSIGYGAFSFCSNLSSVTLPDTLNQIGDGVFQYCYGLKSVVIPNSVTSIGNNAFSFCTELTSVNIPNGVTSIGDEAFYCCSALTSVNIPNGVTSIGAEAFYGCSALTSIDLPDSISSIGNSAFSYCKGLKSVKLPAGITSIEKYLFSDCTALTSVNIPYGVTSIGYGAFSECSALTSVNIPNSVTSIENGALLFCDSLKYVILPESVKLIDGWVFDYEIRIYCYSDYVKNYCKENYLNYFDLKNNSGDCVTLSSLSSTSAGFTRMSGMPAECSVQLYCYDTATNTYKYYTALTSSKKSVTISSLTSDTVYKYRSRLCTDVGGTKIYSAYTDITFRTKPSVTQLNTVRDKINAGSYASTTTASLTLGSNNYTYTSDTFGRWAYVSDICQFTDQNGKLNIAYTDGNYVVIVKLDDNGKKTGSLKIAKKYPLLGDVECDSKGNYYIVWATEATAAPGDASFPYSEIAIAVSKYNSSGTHIKTVTYTRKEVNTAQAFHAGNCDTVIMDNVLICNYARLMCNGSFSGHQSNNVIAVYTDTMAKCDEYSTYNSHSFDQRIITDSKNNVWLASHGDSYSRAFTAQKNDEEYDRFHFYCDAAATTNMWVLNVTNAQLGGLAESSFGVMLVGASVKGMTEKEYNSQTKNLFITSADNSYAISGAVSRTGIVKGESTTDTNIKWLTSYTKSFVNNPQCVSTDDGRIVILWEAINADTYDFIDSYYMILNADCTVAQPATPMKGLRLNSNEMPIYKNGCIYWASAEGNKCSVVKLNVGKLVEKNTVTPVSGLKLGGRASDALRLNWNKNTSANGYIIEQYKGGKWVRIAKITNNATTTYRVSGLKAGTAYKFRVKAYRMNGKTALYSKYTAALAARTNPSKVTGVKIGGKASTALRPSWTKNTSADGYIVEIYKGGKWVRAAKLTKNTTTTYRISGLKKNTTYKIRIKAYKMSGKKALYSGYTTISGKTTK